MSQVRAEGAVNWWGICQRPGNKLHSPSPVLIEFDDGTFGAVTALPKFITTVLREGRGISALIYRQINTPPDAAAAAEKAVAVLESGSLRANAVTNLAVEIRQWKHADPVIGVISAYLYDSIGDTESIRRIAYFYVTNDQPIPYDIALLAQLKGTRQANGPISVLVPPVSARKPRTAKEKNHAWTYLATPEIEGEVGGLWPWMRQGWGYLDDLADDDSTLIDPRLVKLIPRLTNARFSTLDSRGGRMLAKIFGVSTAGKMPSLDFP